jgi:hypothetical protein
MVAGLLCTDARVPSIILVLPLDFPLSHPAVHRLSRRGDTGVNPDDADAPPAEVGTHRVCIEVGMHPELSGSIVHPNTT